MFIIEDKKKGETQSTKRHSTCRLVDCDFPSSCVFVSVAVESVALAGYLHLYS